jgi:predicted PurR-regulated permease PerM
VIATPGGPGINWRAVGRVIALVAALLGVLYVLSLIPKTVEVFIVATLIAYGIAPIVTRLSRRMPRIAAIVAAYLGLTAFFGVLLLVIVPDTIEQLQNVLAGGPVYVADVQTALASGTKWLQHVFGAHVVAARVQDLENQGMGTLSGMLGSVFVSAGTVVANVASAVAIGVMAVVLSYFFLSQRDAIRTSYYSLFSERAQPKAHIFAHEVGRVVGGFILGQAALCLICGVLTYIILLLFRFKYALLLGVVAGLLYAVPYIGIVFAVAFGFALGLLGGWKAAVLTAIIVTATSKFCDFLVPKIMGESVGVSPIAIIFAVFAGAELFGLWGLLLAIPAAALFKVVWTLWIHPWLTGKPAALPETQGSAPGADVVRALR